MPWPGNVRELRNVVENLLTGAAEDLEPMTPRPASQVLPAPSRGGAAQGAVTPQVTRRKSSTPLSPSTENTPKALPSKCSEMR
ncbi:MAG: hypothetical protein ABJA82_09985 [Myxococcales bacterium]